MTVFTYPTPNNSIKSMALALLGSGLAVPAVHLNAAWAFNTTLAALTQTAASGTAIGLYAGYTGAAGVATTAYMNQSDGNLVSVTSAGAVASFPMASGHTYVGTVYNTVQLAPYVLGADGSIQTLVGGISMAAVGSGFGNVVAKSFATSGSTLFTALPVAGALGFFTLSGPTAGVSGSVAAPMTVPSCVAASSGLAAVAVGGFNYNAISSGFTQLAVAPNGLSFGGVNSGAGLATTWAQLNGTWTVNGSVSGLGNPAYIGWAPSGTNILASDPTAGAVKSLTYSLGTLTLTQTLSILGAGATSATSDSLHALVCQPSQGKITPLTASGLFWTSGTPFNVGTPTSVLAYGTSGAIIGCSSGLALATMSSGGIWTIAATGAVGFIPGYLARDASGNIYAAGTSGASGLYAIATSGLSVTGSGSFVGSVSGLVLSQGQLALADAVAASIRFFSGPPWAQQSVIAGPAGLDSIAYGNNHFFMAGSAQTTDWSFNGPFSLSQNQVGVVSIYRLGAFSTLTLSGSAIPAALTFDPSGNVSIATTQNTLITISSGAVFIGSSGIAQQTNQPVTTPIGISSMVWVGGHLYASSSLCDAVIQIK